MLLSFSHNVFTLRLKKNSDKIPKYVKKKCFKIPINFLLDRGCVQNCILGAIAFKEQRKFKRAVATFLCIQIQAD